VRQDFRRDPTNRSVPKSQHDSPSPEGSLIRLLAGLLTLASSGWSPSQSPARISGFVDQPSTITVAGPSRIHTGFPIKFPKAPEATAQFLHLPRNLCQAGGAAILFDVTDFHPSAYKSDRTGRYPGYRRRPWSTTFRSTVTSIIDSVPSTRTSPVGATANDGPPRGTPNSGCGRGTEITYVQLVIAFAVRTVFHRANVAASVARGQTISSAPSAPSRWEPPVD